MLVDFENIDYIKVCPQAGLMTNPNNVWGYIKGDITEQKDLMELISNIEIGITPEQIALLQNVEKEINEINASLNMKVDVSEVYTKSEIDDKIDNIDVDVDLTEYATKSYVDAAVEAKVDSSDIWTGTQDEWDAMTTEIQNSYIIAMIQQ
jgi:hypothetical protein